MLVTFENPDGTSKELDLPPIIGTCPLEEVSSEYLDSWRKLLAEPHLVNESIVIETWVGIFLAIPIGVIRRSGSFDFCCEDPQGIVDILKDKPGFPNLRIHEKLVKWGEDPPAERVGEWYGYDSDEIRGFYSDESYEHPLKHCSPSFRLLKPASRSLNSSSVDSIM